jgi:5-methylcytosine-specific restriction endonuclease McrA
MISVAMPKLSDTSEEFYRSVVGSTKPQDKRERLTKACDTIESCINNYRELASKQKLAELVPSAESLGGARPDDFDSLYISFLQATTAVGRKHYEKLLLAHSHRICPYCGTRESQTLDHYLPQSKFPHFSIMFENLVASCFECNKTKGSTFAVHREKMLYHPYYESFPKSSWLLAKINRNTPITLCYYIADGTEDQSRIANQFESLKLSAIFAFHAATELSTSAAHFKSLANSGSKILREHLLDTADSARCHPWYPWKPVLYQTLAEDDWFCEEGYHCCS